MIRKVPLLSGCAILAVVLHHATNWGFIAMFWWTHRYRPVVTPNYDELGSLTYYSLLSINQLALFSVPAFLFIAGLFVTYASNRSAPILDWKVVKARVSGLFWPYLIWSLIIFIFNGLRGIVHSPEEYFVKLITGGAVRAYFFIPLLIQFYLLSPLLIRWVKNKPKFLLSLSASIQLSSIFLRYFSARWDSFAFIQYTLQTLDWFFINWTFYFVLGLFLGFKLKEVNAWITRYKRQLILTTILLAAISLVESQLIYSITNDWDRAITPFKLSSSLYAISFILAFMAFDIKNTIIVRTLSRIGAMSYGIYLIHPKAIEIVSSGVYNFAPTLLAHQLGLAILLTIIMLCGSWVLMTALQKSPFRRTYHYIFG